MINLTIKIFAIFLAVLLQVTLLPLLNIKGIWPNLILTLTFTLAIFDFSDDALLVGGLGGFFYDFFQSTFFGFNTFFLLGFIFLIKFVSKNYFPQTSWAFLFIVIFVGTVVYALMINLIFQFSPSFLIFLEAILNCLLAFGIFLLIRFFQKDKQIIKLGKNEYIRSI